ncbi:PAS domain-containing protein [Denitromonas iodatirespirans]|uniref:histidine kinase n=1 Tax=Denitromonas iodatirespirans TaxID=2795389 RepID=A0A944DMQ9_DENI1|nr:PAS domain-containing protein [Denitromonas iodatirespirans]MBT0961489.1 PAS domain-containing protein [Denitromonas iodatirespirans]
MSKGSDARRWLASQLRRSAETLLAGTPESAPTNLDRQALRAHELEELLHELQVHQVELEMQNEALCAAQLDLAEARDRYLDLFECAPVGYLTLNIDGFIEEINQTAGTLLATPRSRLLGRRLAGFVAAEDRNRWNNFHLGMKQASQRQDCELRLCRPTGECFVAHLSGQRTTSINRPVTLRLTLTDLSDAHQLDALKENALRLKLAVEAMSGGLYDWNRQTGRVYWSSALKRVFGAHDGELDRGRVWWRANVHPQDLRRIRPAVLRAIRNGESQFSIEYRIQSLDGRWIYVADRAHIERNAKGRIYRFVGTLIDITEHKKMELAQARQNESLEEKVAQRTAEAETRARDLAEAERFARGIIDSLSSRLCVLDEHGNIIATNRVWREYVEAHCVGAGDPHSGRAAAGDPLADGSGPMTAAVRRAVKDMLSGKRRSYQLEYESTEDGDVRWFNMTITRFAGEGPVRLVIRHDDITQRKLVELESERTAMQLKQLGRHLQSAREAQSALIARELHDELGAGLTMLKLALATMADEAEGIETFEGRFGPLIKQVDSALKVTKRISGSLRPAMLDTLGLVETIRWYLPQFSDATGIKTLLRLPDYVRLSNAANIIVFRIIQEGLTNVARHAGANRAWVHAHKRKGWLMACIADDGVGISHEAVYRQDAFGIIGMRERAQSVDGELSIKSRRAGGTRLCLCLPLDS